MNAGLKLMSQSIGLNVAIDLHQALTRLAALCVSWCEMLHRPHKASTSDCTSQCMLVVQVTLTGGAEHPAKIVGYDEDRDVAVLQLITTEGEPVSSKRAATPAFGGDTLP